MKLIIVNYALHMGGTDRVVAVLANSFSSIGFNVTVVTLRPVQEDFYDLDPAVNRVDLGIKVDDSRRKGVGYIGLSAAVALLRLRKIVKDIDPDFVISNWTSINCFTLISLLGQRRRVVVYEHIHFGSPSFFWRLLRRIIYPFATVVTALTEGDCSQLKKINRRTLKVKNPLTVRPSALSERNGRRILGVGRLVSQKGFDLLIEAFALLSEECPDWTLSLVGDGPERQNLEMLAQKLGVAERVYFHGAQSSVGKFYESASIFVLSSRFEGFGLVIIEAQAHGVPVVAFDCPRGPSEIIRHGYNGLLVEPEDVKELAAAIKKLIRNPYLAERFSVEGRRTAQEYSQEAVLQQWLKLLNSHA